MEPGGSQTLDFRYDTTNRSTMCNPQSVSRLMSMRCVILIDGHSCSLTGRSLGGVIEGAKAWVLGGD